MIIFAKGKLMQCNDSCLVLFLLFHTVIFNWRKIYQNMIIILLRIDSNIKRFHECTKKRNKVLLTQYDNFFKFDKRKVFWNVTFLFHTSSI